MSEEGLEKEVTSDKRAEFFYQLAQEQHRLMKEIDDSYTAIITDFLKVILTIMTIISGLMYYLLSNNISQLFFYVIIALLLLLFSAILGVVAHRPKGIVYLDPKKFYDRHYSEPYSDVVEVAAVTIADTIKAMRKRNKEKTIIFQIMLILTISGLAVMIAAFIDFFLTSLT